MRSIFLPRFYIKIAYLELVYGITNGVGSLNGGEEPYSLWIDDENWLANARVARDLIFRRSEWSKVSVDDADLTFKSIYLFYKIVIIIIINK